MLGGIGLAPVGTSQHIENDPALTGFHDFEKRPACKVLGAEALGPVRAVLKELFRQEIKPQCGPGGEDHSSLHGAQGHPSQDFAGRSLFEIMETCERRVILDMLARTNWSQTDAAEHFKIPLSTLNQKIKRLQIDVKRRGES